MNTKTMLTCTAVVIALALIVAPLAISESVFADNKAKQKIKQKESNKQRSLSVGQNNILSGNNVNFQGQINTGGNNLAQSD